ncbi:hypothetical protein SAMN05443669_103512 [Flavobacterium xanthum]|uniref:Uncharacterized protein n=1 Tax=Flavobacterium xanthum TaxID=69322 RepID=A0A1M7IJS1_9FLAO|nr:hypothetical protein SAMN05443669_103512 [Flavobacterium xanthum]
MKVVHNKMDYSESHNQYAIARYWKITKKI